MKRRHILQATGALILLTTGNAWADPMAEAKAVVDKYASKVTTWDGPKSAPKPQPGKTIVVLAGDLKNGGILGVSNGVEEAAKAIGWQVKVLDGAGSIGGRTAAFGQAMALKPDAIIIDGFDAVEQAPALEQAKAAKIPLVAWHAGPTIGPDEKNGLFANISTDAMEVSKSAANWAYVDAKGKPGVIIFTDSTYAIAIAKADKMKAEIERLGGKVLAYVDTPIAETSQRMPQLTTSLLQKYGDSWTHTLAINDLYFDFMGPSLASAGKGGTDAPINVAAGDGSESAYQRIRAGQYQKVTVAEPLNLQGWQLVDELNRALNGEKWSGYMSPLHVVTADNVEFDGGPKNSFDPDNGYRDAYKKIWGK
ncbi:substrate-binding domain-containing protein [Agrobacterium vitis]|uniref:ABC transporter substrate-binding protein n=1 Tax=Rhizobium/Agrobacterium group TaxID=227290 RepID=UPI0008DC1D84|nr:MULTISPECIES: substrate-binding domain-containing protein [Rhizobium/Agrobacterium group]MCF1432444.1 substrate-binding domain-containing protein [Allorhizobium ampelinum]MUO88020.1 substrate-binding domain-containing protein [Agrobacterium vitis]MUZ50851.1 substrate-binding domain-containing protein [Agrobacterium vitis]MUZ90821.1 substrate-binding domain-containing protein [Agrobacterium vitis]MVA38768.1 substrate-binding domain-containing protein [Agrobacterium vitis]